MFINVHSIINNSLINLILIISENEYLQESNLIIVLEADIMSNVSVACHQSVKAGT